jgi:predicted dithiol-disulfide oxidoreductase (DUF899 family)
VFDTKQNKITAQYVFDTKQNKKTAQYVFDTKQNKITAQYVFDTNIHLAKAFAITCRLSSVNFSHFNLLL